MSTTAQVIELFPRAGIIRPQHARIGRRRGFTWRDLSFLTRVYIGGSGHPLSPVHGEKSAADRLRRAGFIRHADDDRGAYQLTKRGEHLLGVLIDAVEHAE